MRVRGLETRPCVTPASPEMPADARLGAAASANGEWADNKPTSVAAPALLPSTTQPPLFTVIVPVPGSDPGVAKSSVPPLTVVPAE